MALRPVAERQARSLFALAWLAQLFRRCPPEETALAMYSPLTEEMAAAREEVEAIAPWSAGQWEVDQPRTARVQRILLALVLMTLPVALVAGLGVSLPTPSTEPRCTFADGTSVQGTCMFVDEFTTSLDTSVWNAEDNWNGPLQNVAPDVSCFRHENVTVSGGNLALAMTANARGSCPQTWSTTAYYTSNYNASWPTGAATSYDVGVVSHRSFRMKYGHIAMRITLPPGRGPGGDVTLWGTGCQRSAGVIDALSDLFTLAAGRTCDWPNIGSAEMDVIQSSRVAGLTTINTSVYTASSPGTPALISNFFGINYYGARWAQPATGGFTTWMGGTVATPTASFHVYELDWSAARWSVTVDGLIQALENPTPPTWIPSGSMFLMLWNAATVAVTPGDLPSSMLVDYIRITCPPGYGCTWSGAGAL